MIIGLKYFVRLVVVADLAMDDMFFFTLGAGSCNMAHHYLTSH